VFRLTGSAAQTAALAALAAVPYLLFGLVAGAVADRVDRRRLMGACDLLSAALVASIPLAAAFGVLSLLQLYAVALLTATLFVWFDAANFGALPALVGRARIVAANSAVSATHTVIGIAGPAVAGLLAATVGPAQSVALDAASFAASALFLAAIPRPFRAGPGALAAAGDAAGARAPVLRRTSVDVREGLAFLWGRRRLRTLTLPGAAHSFAGGAVTGVLVVCAVRGLGLPAGDACIGWLFSAGAAGSLGAALLLPRLSARFPVGWISLAGYGAGAVLLVALTLAPGPALGLSLYLLWSGASGLRAGHHQRHLPAPAGDPKRPAEPGQRHRPHHRLGRDAVRGGRRGPPGGRGRHSHGLPAGRPGGGGHDGLGLALPAAGARPGAGPHRIHRSGCLTSFADPVPRPPRPGGGARAPRRRHARSASRMVERRWAMTKLVRLPGGSRRARDRSIYASRARPHPAGDGERRPQRR
jgi:hypothetical protein